MFPEVELKVLGNRQVYLIIEKSFLFGIDSDDQTVTTYDLKTLQQIKYLHSGIATCQFYETNAIAIKNNEGKDLLYYPMVKKCYPKDNILNT